MNIAYRLSLIGNTDIHYNSLQFTYTLLNKIFKMIYKLLIFISLKKNKKGDYFNFLKPRKPHALSRGI